MPISTEWGNDEKTIIDFTITDVWSLEEAWDTLKLKALPMANSLPYVPDVILDFSKSRKTPRGLMEFWRQAFDWMQENQLASSMVLFVKPSPVMQGIGNTLRTLRIPIMKYMFFANSIDEAYQKITEHRANNPHFRFDN